MKGLEGVAKSIEEWVADEVRPYEDKPIGWLSEYHFFRDPARPTFTDPSFFFAPADGIVVYQEEVAPTDRLVEIKGQIYTLQEAMRDKTYDRRSLVIGIFMTFFDVHINRIPHPGRLSYKALDPIDTYNHPMLSVEKSILDDLRIHLRDATYLLHNQRMLNRVDNSDLGIRYYILQVADYDVDSIMPFDLKQNQPTYQGERFSQIRFGSQVDLVIPLDDRYRFTPVQTTGVHVEAGVDPLVRVEATNANETPRKGR